MTKNNKGARHSSPTSSRSKETRRNVVLVLIASLLIVAAMFYAWGQTVQHEHAEAVHNEVIAHA